MRKVILIVAIALVAVAVVLVALVLNGPPQVDSGSPTVVSAGSSGFPAPPKAEYLAEPPDEAFVIDMKYRGLTSEEDDLSYHSYWGYGGGGSDQSKFIKAVKKKVSNIHPVYNPNFKGAEWSALQYEGKDVQAFYFDLNADGRLSDNERIVPTAKPENGSLDIYTPDFTMTTREGRQVRFRAMLRVRFYDSMSHPNCMWSPACVLQGSGRIDQEQVEAVLYADGFQGNFDAFGLSRLALLVDQGHGKKPSVQQTLSSLFNHDGKFYRIKFCEADANDVFCRVAFVPDTNPTGKLAIDLSGKEDLDAKLSSATIKGANDESIHFSISGGGSSFPQGDYVLNRGYLRFGAGQDRNWYVDFKNGPEFAIEPNETVEIELGKPEIMVSAVEANKRYSSDVQEKATYEKGTVVYLTPKVVGLAGEEYGRLRQVKNSQYTDIEPTVSITDAEGNELVSKNMEYG